MALNKLLAQSYIFLQLLHQWSYRHKSRRNIDTTQASKRTWKKLCKLYQSSKISVSNISLWTIFDENVIYNSCSWQSEETEYRDINQSMDTCTIEFTRDYWTTTAPDSWQTLYKTYSNTIHMRMLGEQRESDKAAVLPASLSIARNIILLLWPKYESRSARLNWISISTSYAGPRFQSIVRYSPARNLAFGSCFQMRISGRRWFTSFALSV